MNNIALHIGSGQLGGTEKHVVRIVRGLLHRGYCVHLIFDKCSGPLFNQIKKMNIEIYSNPIHANLFSRIIWFLRTYKYLYRKKIQLLHVFNDVSIVYFGLVLLFVNKVKYIVSIRHSGLPFTGYKRKLISFVCKLRSNCIITNSQNGKKNLNKLYKISKKNIRVIHNGLDLDDYSNIEDDIVMRKVLEKTIKNSRKNYLVIGQVSRLNNMKDIDTLVHAAKILNNENIVFIIIGDGPENERIQILINHLGLNHKIFLLGAKYPSLNWIQLFDIAVLSSLDEGLPNSILEYMMLGKPVVASKVGGVPETVINGKTGYLVEPLNEKAMADVLLMLVRDKNLRDEFGRNGKAHAMKYFSSESEINSHLIIYNNLLR
jgi:glycosyltransferase involved in cell wall biosynthesis